MTFDEYQAEALKTAVYEDEAYPFLALPEEVGEFLGLLAKMARGDDVKARFGSEEAFRERLKKEAGDILWQLTACLHELEMSLGDVARANVAKLRDRQERGVLQGSGDLR